MIVQAGPTGTADVGCSARFETLVRRFEDGRLNVDRAGRRAGAAGRGDRRAPLLLGPGRAAGRRARGGAAPSSPTRCCARYRALAGLRRRRDARGARGHAALLRRRRRPSSCPPAPKQELLESRDEGAAPVDARRALHGRRQGDASTRAWRPTARRTNGKVIDAVSAPGRGAPARATGYALLRGGAPAVGARPRRADLGGGPRRRAASSTACSPTTSRRWRPARPSAALLLDAKGHVQAALRVRRDAEDAFTLRRRRGRRRRRRGRRCSTATTSPRTSRSSGPRRP